MSKKIKYSLLKYRHSHVLDELLNIGMVYFVPSSGDVRFIYPKRIQRLSNLYHDIDLSLIKIYQHAFTKRASKISLKLKRKVNSEPLIDLDLHFLIKKYFLVDDAGAFFFSEEKSGYFPDASIAERFLKTTFFSCYNEFDLHERNDEQYILRRVLDAFKVIPSIDYSLLNTNVKIGTPGKLQAKFPYAWKNGTLNLIAPVSFDLKEEIGIFNKAFQWRGKLDVLSNDLTVADARVDLIIAKPTESKFLGEYEAAIEALRNTNNSRIVEEEQIESYASDAAAYLIN